MVLETNAVLLAGWAVSLLAVLLPQIYGRRGETRARLWTERRDSYAELLDWLAADVDDPEAHGRPPHPLQVKIDLYGTDQLDVRLQGYRKARTRTGASSPEVTVQHGLLRLQVRYELDAAGRRLDRSGVSLLGRRPFRLLLMRLSTRYRRKHGFGNNYHDGRPHSVSGGQRPVQLPSSGPADAP